MKIEIKGKLPSYNEYQDQNRRNPHAGGQMKKSIEQLIGYQLVKMDKITEPVVIHFLWHEKTRRRDKDNVAFAKKFILDAMQKTGKLPNDNNKYIAGFTDSFDYGSEWGVTVEIEAGRDTGEP